MFETTFLFHYPIRKQHNTPAIDLHALPLDRVRISANGRRLAKKQKTSCHGAACIFPIMRLLSPFSRRGH